MSEKYFLKSINMKKQKITTVVFVVFGLLFWFSSINEVKSQQTIETFLKQTYDSVSKMPFYKPYKITVKKDVFLKLVNKLPSFGLAKDNYFITGIPTNARMSKYNTDVKYQISIRQRLTKTVLPFDTYLFITYTQKAFWDIYRESSPFVDINYNPTFGLGKPIIVNNKFYGLTSLMMEHESNGRDSIYSRSWNYISLSGIYFYNSKISFQAKFWLPFVGEGNEDLLDYRGYGQVVVNYSNSSRMFRTSLIINPNKDFSRVNTTLDLNFKLNNKFNQYIFIQLFNGYAEGLLNYNERTSMVRLGICIKQQDISIY